MTRKFGMLAMAGLAAIALTGCGSKDAGKDGAQRSVDDVAREASELVKPLPGEYRQVMEITSLEVPGVPKEAAEQMKGLLRATQEGSFCLSKEQAANGFKDILNKVGKGGECSYSKFKVDGGKLDAQMECLSPEADGTKSKAVMKMNGVLAETGSDIAVEMDTSGGPPPIGTMKMKMKMTTTRLGECKA